jgi:hypothetical protein
MEDLNFLEGNCADVFRSWQKEKGGSCGGFLPWTFGTVMEFYYFS